MLKIEFPETDFYDSKRNEFLPLKRIVLLLEHSLLSISKWEAKWKKPLINNLDKLTDEEFLDYVRCMVIGNLDDETLGRFTLKEFNMIREYMDDPMTATTFPDTGQAPSREIITSEVVYAWMAEAQIPFSCEKWHINRLMVLIKCIATDREPSKKMSKKDTAAMYKRLNEQRKAKLKSKG